MLNPRQSLDRIIPNRQMRQLIQRKNALKSNRIFNFIMMQVQNFQFVKPFHADFRDDLCNMIVREIQL